jgi:two-component system sensor histidine kinase AlgZ
MHPILKSRSGLIAYLVAWIPLGVLFVFVICIAGHLNAMQAVAFTVPLTIVMACVCLSSWFVCRSLPLRTTSFGKLIVHHTLAAMLASTVVIVIMNLTVMGMGTFVPPVQYWYHSAVPVLAVMVLLIFLLSVALHYVLLALESSQRSEVLSREAELKALKAQINPHFLFNSLNSISALTSVDPARAREMCVRLSDFLRNSLRLGEHASVPFSEELELTRTYLDVERVRFGQRLRIKQDFEPACNNCEIPPLLVQPLVENAIKHGIATLTEGGEIEFAARRHRDSMRITVENPFDPEAPAARKTGFGLVNVRNRLQARYGAAGKLEIQVDRDRYRVMLSFPCIEAKGKSRK